MSSLGAANGHGWEFSLRATLKRASGRPEATIHTPVERPKAAQITTTTQWVLDRIADEMAMSTSIS